MKKVLLCCLILFFWFTSNLTATPITNDFGLTSPMNTISFSEFSIVDDVLVTTQYQILGVTFSSNLRQINTLSFSSPNIAPGALKNYFPVVNPFSILFDTDQTEAAFAMITYSGISSFTAFLDDIPVQSFSTATNTNNVNNFYGFSEIIFDEIVINIQNGSGFMILDNLQFSNNSAAIPEPTTIVLFGFGLLSLAGVSRRRK